MRGTGYVAEPLESTADIPLCSGSMPDECDNRSRCGEVTDQAWTSSCVDHALANAIQMLLSTRWHIAPKPCILSLYGLARVHAGKPIGEDSGTSLRCALEAVTTHGYCPDALWPWNPEAVRQGEPWDVLQAAFDQIGLRWHVISTDRKRMIKAAVCQGLPVLVGAMVDESFDALRSLDVWPGCEGGSGHCMLIVGYDSEGVIVMNSWGITWGALGFGRIAWSYICGENTHIVAVLDEA